MGRFTDFKPELKGKIRSRRCRIGPMTTSRRSFGARYGRHRAVARCGLASASCTSKIIKEGSSKIWTVHGLTRCAWLSGAIL
jgi:hypothetical protein